MTAAHTDNEENPSAPGWLRRVAHRLMLTLIVLTGLCIATLAMIRYARSVQQQHEDPHVATAWVAGVSLGPKPTLQTGNALMRWFNRQGVQIFGKAETLVGRYTGSQGGVEIWLGYRSHLRGKPQLECHRVGRTAFTDDLGQEYHGYLDFQGSCVGIYLPGYDHAAHQLTCALHWMPRAPAPPTPVSLPMVFHVDLPPVRRILPTAVHLSSDSATETREGITVTAGSARLDAPKESMGVGGGQRDLIFHLNIQGGALTGSNVNPCFDGTARAPVTFGGFLRLGLRPATPAHHALEITDPYGVPMVATGERVTPMMSLDATRCTRDRDGVVWIVPVNGAGKGTDVIHMQLFVQPDDRSRSPIPFEFTLPVTMNEEI